jgi:hypothetical protein
MPQKTQTQSDRFKEAARALECDDDEAHFDAKLKKVAKAPKPKDPTQEDEANG